VHYDAINAAMANFFNDYFASVSKPRIMLLHTFPLWTSWAWLCTH